MALGATRSGMVRAFMTESLALVVVGIAAGALATVGVTRLIASRLFGVGAADPVTMAIGIMLVVLAAALAAALPARRAARVDPMVALRFE
jgi:ABC-type antimicrobial peptide transport system permease subunit